MDTVPVLFVTGNVGSIFEDPSRMLKLWTEEFVSKVEKCEPKFLALHCQEIGGKSYKKSRMNVELFVKDLINHKQLEAYNRVCVFLDENYDSPENFTALGSFYFIHNSVGNALIWDFKQSQFVPVVDKQVFSGIIEDTPIKEKAKFPQIFFPDRKLSRKGFMRTRWYLCGTVFDLVNIHLFHDASNLLAMSAYPSVYCTNRRRALEHTLQRFRNDCLEKAPYFIFGDFNFRTDTEAVIKKLTSGLIKTRIQNTKNNEHTKLHFINKEENLVLSIGKKEFSHCDHEKIFLSYDWLRGFDRETEPFTALLTEYPITFAPSYPFEEKISKATSYMSTRCPAWCDRVLLSHSTKKIIDRGSNVEYGLLGVNICMGDHKPVFLKFHLRENAGVAKCEGQAWSEEAVEDTKKENIGISSYINIENVSPTVILKETAV